MEIELGLMFYLGPARAKEEWKARTYELFVVCPGTHLVRGLVGRDVAMAYQALNFPVTRMTLPFH